MSEEEIKLINETMQLDYSQLVMSCVHLYMEKKKLKSQLQQRENIIKETIKRIKEKCIDDEFYVNLSNKEKAIIDVLVILENEVE